MPPFPSNTTLMAVATGIGLVGGVTALTMHSQLQKSFKQTVFVTESLKTLRNSRQLADHFRTVQLHLATPISAFQYASTHSINQP